jgi:hypothetical protein
LPILRSEGNLLLELDRANPTQILLAAIRSHDLCTTYKGTAQAALKDDERFYIGAFDGGEVCAVVVRLWQTIDSFLTQISQIHEVSSGDPSRGTIALKSPSAPSAGTQIQVCCHSEDCTCPPRPFGACCAHLFSFVVHVPRYTSCPHSPERTTNRVRTCLPNLGRLP